jgi:undecaprenyl-diphosphatase
MMSALYPLIDQHAGGILLALMLAAAAGLWLHRRHARTDALAGVLRLGPGAARTRHLRGLGRRGGARLRLPHLALAGAAAFAGFLLVAWLVHSPSPPGLLLAAWDRRLAGGPPPPAWALAALGAVTFPGNAAVMAVVGAAVLATLLVCREWLLAGAWTIGVAGNGLCVRFFKLLFARARPVHDHALAEHGYGFPSGHAAGALMVYGLLAWLVLLGLAGLPGRRRPAVAAAAAVLVACVATSRVLLQVHYLSDVLAGLLMGFAWLALVICVTEQARGR